MRRAPSFPRLVTLVAGAMIWTGASAALSAQVPRTSTAAPAADLRETAYIGVGYVANAPNLFIGGSLSVVPRPGLPGLYLDLKTTYDPPSSHPYYLPDITVEQAEAFGDVLFRTGESWTSVNVALVWPVHGEMAVYGGGGLTRESAFREYQDLEEERGRSGYYWIDDRAASGDYLNLLGGIFFQAGRRLLFQFGAELRPPGATVGATYLFPIGR
jgi:hypothetical protein